MEQAAECVIFHPEHLAGAPKQHCLAYNLSGLQETVAVRRMADFFLTLGFSFSSIYLHFSV